MLIMFIILQREREKCLILIREMFISARELGEKKTCRDHGTFLTRRIQEETSQLPGANYNLNSKLYFKIEIIVF